MSDVRFPDRTVGIAERQPHIRLHPEGWFGDFAVELCGFPHLDGSADKWFGHRSPAVAYALDLQETHGLPIVEAAVKGRFGVAKGRP